ncbi:hypothetical protein HUB94_11300 [Paenibacillus cellulosilyticus]|uniref:hypothetical protein n=1 Tax=Paenibacillus cellulosilyticus TaxID=375489 RepID=UPI000D71D020|nr:hypothetical protein [Paenibacillus cellulosilyticus]QKS44930.1 hypothetical protein HUB94_11300 [Paenibacillus cellulosilyticus]
MKRTIQNIDLIELEIKEFKWNKCVFITEFHFLKVLNKYFEEVSVLETQLEYKEVDSTYIIKLQFKSIQNLNLSCTTDYGIQLSSFEITDISDDGWSDLNYKVNDYETENVKFYCNEIEIISVTRM